MTWSPVILSLQLALATTLVLLLVGLPLAWWLARTQTRFKPVVESLVSLPLVLPPTVLGFYFLLAFSPNNAFGMWLDDWLGLRLVFSFPGLVLASVIYSLPFMVQPTRVASIAVYDEVEALNYAAANAYSLVLLGLTFLILLAVYTLRGRSLFTLNQPR